MIEPDITLAATFSKDKHFLLSGMHFKMSLGIEGCQPFG